MESQHLILVVGGVELVRDTSTAVIYDNLNGKNFAGEENRDKSYSQHIATLEFIFNGDTTRASFAPGTALQLLSPTGEVLQQSSIAHHANLAAMPVELILPCATGIDDDDAPEDWALFVADQPLSGHFTGLTSDGRYRAGVLWSQPEAEDFLLFNAAAGAKLQVACSRKEVAKMCLHGRDDAKALLEKPAHILWETISAERERIAGLPYREVVGLLTKVRSKLKKAA